MASIETIQAHLEACKARRQQLSAELEALDQRIRLLEEVLDVPSIPATPSPTSVPLPAPSPPDAYLRLSDALVEVAQRHRRPMAAKQYREWLPTVGFSREASYQNIYNTLTRLVEKRRLARSQEGTFGLNEDVKAANSAAIAVRASYSR